MIITHKYPLYRYIYIDETKKILPNPWQNRKNPGVINSKRRLDPSGQSPIGSSQVDALEDQKDRLTNGLEKLRATSEQAKQWAFLLSLRIRWWQLLKYFGRNFHPQPGGEKNAM